MARQQVQVAGDDLQQVIEVVGHAAGEAADGFEFLRLAQLVFGSRTRLHFVGDPLFQVVRQFLAHTLGFHVLGGLSHDYQDAGGLLVVVSHRTVGKIHPDFFRLAVT